MKFFSAMYHISVIVLCMMAICAITRVGQGDYPEDKTWRHVIGDIKNQRQVVWYMEDQQRKSRVQISSNDELGPAILFATGRYGDKASMMISPTGFYVRDSLGDSYFVSLDDFAKLGKLDTSHPRLRPKPVEVQEVPVPVGDKQ